MSTRASQIPSFPFIFLVCSDGLMLLLSEMSKLFLFEAVTDFQKDVQQAL